MPTDEYRDTSADTTLDNANTTKAAEYRDTSADTTLDNANTTKAAERIPPMQEDSASWYSLSTHLE